MKRQLSGKTVDEGKKLESQRTDIHETIHESGGYPGYAGGSSLRGQGSGDPDAGGRQAGRAGGWRRRPEAAAVAEAREMTIGADNKKQAAFLLVRGAPPV
jgi:hypothetical protein